MGPHGGAQLETGVGNTSIVLVCALQLLSCIHVYMHDNSCRPQNLVAIATVVIFDRFTRCVTLSFVLP
jgi:hypothetical protein